MGKVYDSYEKLKIDGNVEQNAQLIYILTAIETGFKFQYSINRSNTMNQFWLHTRIKCSEGENTVMLQATQFQDGNIKLSIKGLWSIDNNIDNHIDYISDHNIFMDYLKYF